mgnify:CR=1 FL=1
MSDDRHYVTTVDGQFGKLTLVATDRGLRALIWPDDSSYRVPMPSELIAEDDHPILAIGRLQVEEYLAGDRIEFDIKFDLRGTEFQQEVWLSLASIPLGQTATYGEQASRIGRPKAVRAVGGAIGRNPISIILPCHRVIGASGDLTGFAGGIETKRSMLVFERAVSRSLLNCR